MENELGDLRIPGRILLVGLNSLSLKHSLKNFLWSEDQIHLGNFLFSSQFGDCHPAEIRTLPEERRLGEKPNG